MKSVDDDPEGASVRRLIGLLSAAALLAVSMTLFGCAAEELAPPAQAVQDLLVLRSENSTDTAGYERVLEETAVAEALVEDAAMRDEASPIPEWETPRVESSEDTSASVVVVWKISDGFEGWPKSTTFLLTKTDEGRWVISDVSEAESSASEPATATP